MKARGSAATVCLAAVLLGACHRAPSAPAPVPVARVQVVPLAIRSFHVRVLAYGLIQGAPGDQWNVGRPYETEIQSVYVGIGQRVHRGQRLLKVEPGPSARIQAAQWHSEALSSKALLAGVRRRYHLQLATKAELLQAEQQYAALRIRLRALREDSETLYAPMNGVVTQLPYQAAGTVVPAAHALVSVTAGRNLQARLGVEPAAAQRIVVGARVRVQPLGHAQDGVMGQVAAVSGSVDPVTGLVSVFVNLPVRAPFLVGEYVRAALTTASAKGLVVPRSAVLPQGPQRVLYTVQGGTAVRHVVRILLTNRKAYEIEAADLQPGAAVVVLGNYELRPGMKVQLQK